ncbi:MAG: hypothetical protein HUK20_00870 [Fibrobacter sp.]|nr:hypothetical protein [Fibrobacter sp.]
MKNSIICLALVTGLSLGLTGCLKPSLHSMGSNLMPVPVQHRTAENSTESEFSVATSGFVEGAFEATNVKKVVAAGGDVSATYRLGGVVSPLFFNAAVGGFGGRLKFDCTEDKCGEGKKDFKKYEEWLETSEAHEHYNFWEIQERLMVGADFSVGSYVLLGLAGGVQLYQGGGSYDDKRSELDDIRAIDRTEDDYGLATVVSLWIGFRLGANGKYGTITEQLDNIGGNGVEMNQSSKLTYTHPSGFFGGFALESKLDAGVYFGKNFVF